MNPSHTPNRQLHHDIQNLLSQANEEQLEAILELLNNKVRDNTQNIIHATSQYKLLRPINPEDKAYINEFFKTFVSIGVTDQYINSSQDLSEPSPNDPEHSLYNYGKNYKEWLGKKLFLSHEEIEKKTIEDIDNLMSRHILSAIKHIEKFLGMFPADVQENLKSEYFSSIHNGNSEKTVFNLLKIWYALVERKKFITKEEKSHSSIGKNYAKMHHQIDIASYEIQRILALALLYIDREKNHNHQHVPEDLDFVLKKLKGLTKNPILNDGKIDPENPLYHLVNTKQFYWGKENGKYVLNEEKGDDTTPIELDTITLAGKTRDFRKTSQTVHVRHIASRMSKSPYSSVDKIIRKDLSSFNQIIDHKGFIFVVDNFEEGKKLLRIIENELATLQSSWIEEPEFMSNSGNENTNSHYNSLKGTLKIPYKGKLIRDFFSLLEDHFKTNGELLRRVDSVKNSCVQNPNKAIQRIHELLSIELENDEKLKKLFTNLKKKFNKKEYNIEIEIQVFDVENYLKAEVDTSSPAHHDHYKNKQTLLTLPKYFPAAVYGEENIRPIIEKN